VRRTLAAVGDIAPELAWRRYAELDQWSQWAPFILGVDAPARVLDAGLSGIVRGPLGIRAVFAVDTVEAPQRRWTWTVRSGPAVLELGHEILARPDGGTVATLELVGATPVVLGYLGPATLALRRLVTPPRAA
jgi:hypothetical protein